jgi:lipoprotein-anchoring transpeptidase ErfK/SrfK
VRIGGVAVGGLTPTEASAAVRTAFARPVRLVFSRSRFLAAPAVLGATANIERAVERARTAAPGSTLALAVAVDRPRTAAYVARLARRFERPAVDARLVLRNARPVILPERAGRRIDRARAVRDLVARLTANVRRPVRLVSQTFAASVRRADFHSIVVIRRSDNRLTLYDGARLVRQFAVATGQSAYPTPLGRFSIVVKWKNPWWYPPASPWAKDATPIPPGPGNPLGTRWMGLTAPGVGIHGTPDAASIGYSVSHGCIRMRIPEAEWLFNHVSIGTTVFIVPH